MTTRYFLALFFAVFLLAATNAACQEETTALTSCLTGDCTTCVALDGETSWSTCEAMTSAYCDAIDNCVEECGQGCIDILSKWATCNVEAAFALPEQGDCSLDCQTGRVDDGSTSSASSVEKYKYLVVLVLLGIFV